MVETSPNIRDITQVYNQSTTHLEREVYIRPPEGMHLPLDMIMKVVKSLYGIPESGLYWYLTYMEHHILALNMIQFRVDRCLLFQRVDRLLSVMVILQVDDSLIVGTKSFLRTEDEMSAAFLSKLRKAIGKTKILIHGVELSLTSEKKIRVTQQKKILDLKTPTTQESFRRRRALAQYIGVNCRPDICITVRLIAPGNSNVEEKQYKSLKKVVDHLKGTSDLGLNFIILDVSSARVFVCSDKSFTNAPGMENQFIFFMLMVDNHNRANIVHYGSSKCHRVARAEMEAEVHALFYAFYRAYMIQKMPEKMLCSETSLEEFVESRTLFNVIAKDSRTAERRILIIVFALRESYRRGALKRIGWIPGNENAADIFTKKII